MAQSNDRETRGFQGPLDDSNFSSDELTKLLEGGGDTSGSLFEDNSLNAPISEPTILSSNIGRVKQPRKRKANVLALFLFILILAGVGYWLYSGYKNKKNFAEPSTNALNNTIRITSNTIEALPQTDKLTSSTNLEIDSSKIGKGNYYLALDNCSFASCINDFENILTQANLPISKFANAGNFKFLQLVSNQILGQSLNSSSLEFVKDILKGDLNLQVTPALANKNKITIGLFTTLQNAKTIKNKIESEATKRGLDLSFSLNQVAVKQTVVKVYSGPYQDENTASKVLSELSATSPIKDAKIVRLSDR